MNAAFPFHQSLETIPVDLEPIEGASCDLKRHKFFWIFTTTQQGEGLERLPSNLAREPTANIVTLRCLPPFRLSSSRFSCSSSCFFCSCSHSFILASLDQLFPALVASVQSFLATSTAPTSLALISRVFPAPTPPKQCWAPIARELTPSFRAEFLKVEWLRGLHHHILSVSMRVCSLVDETGISQGFMGLEMGKTSSHHLECKVLAALACRLHLSNLGQGPYLETECILESYLERREDRSESC